MKTAFKKTLFVVLPFLLTSCSVFGGHEHSSAKPVEENRIEPTCLSEGSYDLVTYCANGSEELSREHHTIPALGHDLVHHNGKEPTCDEKGYAGYDTCSRCDYSTYSEIQAVGHTPGTPVEENRNEPTCTENGSYDLVTYCAKDGEEIERETIIIPAKGHSDFVEVKRNIVSATCTENGSYDLIKYCGVCGIKISDEHVSVLALGHSLIHHHGKPSNCLEHGYDDYYECARCDYSTLEYKPLLDHVEEKKVVENIVAPTDEDSGSFDLVSYCALGGEELSRETIVIGNSENIILRENRAQIFEQDYYRFYVADNSPVSDVTWSVSNEDILTINQNGKLASYSPGESIIFATNSSGEFASAYLRIVEDVISISAPEGTYYPGNTFSMVVNSNSRNDNSKILWSSSDESVATINEGGLVSVIKTGEVVISATLPSGKIDSCSIAFEAHYLELNTSSRTMYRNETYSLLSGCSAPESITWSSSNPSVASVSSSGVVSALSLGTVTITADSELCGTKTCKITVTSATGNLTTSNYSNYISLSVTLTKKQSGGVFSSWYAVVSVSMKNSWKQNGQIAFTLNFPYRNSSTYGTIQKSFSFSSTPYTSSSTFIMDTSYNTDLALINPTYVKPSWNMGSISGTVEK